MFINRDANGDLSDGNEGCTRRDLILPPPNHLVAYFKLQLQSEIKDGEKEKAVFIDEHGTIGLSKKS